MGSEEDKMVRVPKDMYMAIHEIIKKYPHYGWKGPSEFVRDAIRRYVKEIREREIIMRKAMGTMPTRIESILSNFMDEDDARQLANEIEKLETQDPEEYVKKVVDILKSRLGYTLAELLAQTLLEGGENED